MHAVPSHENNFNLIRLLAAVQVAIVHAFNHFGYTFPGFDALKVVPGVPTFFFISGYLIYQSYDRTRHKGLGAFFGNRILRIYPGLLACVLLSTGAVWLTGYFAAHDVPARKILVWVAAQSSFFQFYNPGFMRDFGAGVLNGALWTISVELQFYVLTPILFWLINRARWLAVALFVASVCTNLYVRWFLVWDLLWMKLLYVSFLPWVYMFMLGAALAAFPSLRERMLGANGWLVAAAYVLTMNFVGTYTANASNGINPISFGILGLLILTVANARLPLPTAVTRYVRKEDLSYGLYLYHMPTINLFLVLGLVSGAANIPAVLAVSLLAALFSWYVVERPALRRKL